MMPKKIMPGKGKYTKDEQIVFCLVALIRWKKVKPDKVRLSSWRCGTHACFGGHLSYWPEFRAEGVKPETHEHPEPILKERREGGGEFRSTSVSSLFFGNPNLFSARSGYVDGSDCHDLAISDHAIVVNRLERQIARLSA